MSTWCRVGMIVSLTCTQKHAMLLYYGATLVSLGLAPLCQLMRRTRLSFKYAIRQVKRNEDRARADAMAKDLESKNDKSFWKKVSKINRKHLPLSNVLNACHANMWGDHYETLLNCVKSDECKEKIIDFLSSDINI